MNTIFCKITSGTIVATLLIALCAPLPAQTPESIDLHVGFSKNQHHQIHIQIQHVGDVVIDDFQSESGEQKVLPLDVDAKISFAQRFTGDKDRTQSIRFYQEPSQARIKIQADESTSAVEKSNRWIIARLKDETNELQMASIADVLSQTELELIKNPADPLTLANLLNKKQVKLNDKWSTTNSSLASFLSVDRVYDNDVHLVLKEFNERTAKVYLIGSVKAEIDDVSTEMEISGIAMIQLQEGYVSAIRLNIREQREAGQIAPGFEGQTKIDLRMEPITNIPELTNKRLSELTQTLKIEHRLKLHSEGGEFKIVHDPRWRVIAAETEAAVLRYIDDGDLLAQCNIVQLSPLPKDRVLTMQAFKTDVEKIIKKDEAARVTGFKQSTTPHGLSALKVVVDGIEQSVPVQWVYYHVSATDGRRLTFVFTLEKDVAKLFAPADDALVNELVFLQPATPKKRSAANPDSESTRK